MDSLLPYFEHELSLFNKQSKAFAKKYPKIASRLLMGQDTVDDPHIERLIQAFSLISARINKKLDDSYADFTESLLQVVYPDYQKPLPATSIAQFTTGVHASTLTNGVRIPRHSSFNTQKIKGTVCQFQSTQDVTLLPIAIDEVVFESLKDPIYSKGSYLNGCIKIKISLTNPNIDATCLMQHPIDLYVDNDASQGTSLWDLLYCDVEQTRIRGVRDIHKAGSPFTLLGFDPEQQILPDTNVSNAASTLLKEYFYFPEKFNFLRLELDTLCSAQDIDSQGFEIQCFFKFDKKDSIRLKNLQQLGAGSLKLFCTPMVNIFDCAAKPIQVTHQSVYYDLVPDTNALYQHEVFDVTSVTASKKRDHQLLQHRYYPFYGLNHHEQQGAGRYYHLKRDKDMAEFHQGFEYQIMFVDKHAEDVANTLTMSATLRCTNRDLPSQLLFGQSRGDLFSDSMTGFSRLAFLKQPTRTVRVNYTGDERWRLISLLGLNFLSLSAQNADLLKEYLTLFDAPETAANKQLIDGLVSVETSVKTKRIQRYPQPGFIRGTVIHIGIQKEPFLEVSIRQFAHLLAVVFGYHASLNSFVEIAMTDAVTKEEIYRCQPRSGFAPLI